MKLNHNAINHTSSQADLFNVFTKGYKGKSYIKANTNFRHVDLFSGIGGFRLALDSVGTAPLYDLFCNKIKILKS